MSLAKPVSVFNGGNHSGRPRCIAVFSLVGLLSACGELMSPPSELVASFSQLDVVAMTLAGEPVAHAAVDLVVRARAVDWAVIDSVRGVTDSSGLLRYDRASQVTGWHPLAIRIHPRDGVPRVVTDSVLFERSPKRRTIIVDLSLP